MGLIKDFDIRIHNGGDDAIAAASEFAMEAARLAHGFVPVWIPVSERLPDSGLDVLVLDTTDGMRVAGINNRTHWGDPIWGHPDLDSHLLSVTHWMPLPAPPSDAK